MSFRKKLSTMSEIKNVYVKPYMMPQHVAFEIVAMKRIGKEDNPNEVSNVLFMKYKPGFVLQMWGDKALQEDFNETDVKDFQAALKSEKWYLVTYGKVGTNFPVKILDQQQLASSEASIYDGNLLLFHWFFLSVTCCM